MKVDLMPGIASMSGKMKAAKGKFNGKEYNTLRGYIMARLYAEQGC